MSFMRNVFDNCIYIPSLYLYRGIVNLIKWFKIIWYDRDWDYQYIYDILEFKLKNKIKYFEKTRNYVNWEQDVKYMKICVNLIQKLKTSYYELEIHNYYKFKTHLIDAGNDTKQLEFIPDENNKLNEYFLKNKLEHRKTTITSSSTNPEYLLILAQKIGTKKHLKAKKLLFKILTEKLETWWS